MGRLIWRLAGPTDKVVECFIEPKSGTLHAVTIVVDSQPFVDEIYPDPWSAAARATQVRDSLLKAGHWTPSTGVVVEGGSEQSAGARR